MLNLGGSGKFWIVTPSMKHASNFYVGKMRIAPREMFSVLIRIGGILKDEFDLSKFPTEKKGIWKHPNPCYHCVPPPV